MSTKTKASSKNKKATSKKVVKKTAAKKPVAKKKVTKPVAKAKPVKNSTVKTKPVAKKAASKKPAVKKPVAQKPLAKKVTAKKPVKKVAAKKVVKAVKKVVAKKVVKKLAPKKVAKPAKKAVAKKIVAKVKPVAKPVVKIAPAKVVKPVVVKAPVVKAEKPVKVKKEKPAKVVVKKQIVAPTTFRVDESISTKFIKEPAGKFEMEFVIRASEDMVFEFVSTESGLSEWFCDDVNIRNGVFTFAWDGQEQQAKLVKEVPPMLIRYQWVDKNDGSYFEFRIQKDELTNDISLMITDFADNKADEVSARLLWHSQVDKLLHVLGSFF